MDGNGQPPPDLQSILATLAQFSSTPAPQTPARPVSVENATPASAYFTPQEGPIAQPEARLTPTPKPADPRLRLQNRPANASPKPIDPATITSWQEGLRCVTKIAAQNAQFAASLRRMMKDQRAHEMRWYTERQNLKQVQANRSSSAARAQSILRSLGNGLISPGSASEPEVDKEEELAQFDRKVYAAQHAMETAMTAELKGLGVPFFGTDQKLVMADGIDVTAIEQSDDQPKWSRPVTESQLLDLRRKMVSHLEDLYRD